VLVAESERFTSFDGTGIAELAEAVVDVAEAVG
jgi:hypothetical protein